MQLSVDSVQRHAKMRAHTATHLLHAQLTAIFPQTKQAGSLVDEDYLRFDFYADNTLTDQQIQEIESQINKQIAQALPVNTQEMSYTDATKSWAKAFFEDKYGDTVRVVNIWDKLSVELCGWTHVTNTAHIWAFVIVSQEAVASGVKRITALTGPKVAQELRAKNTELKHIAQALWVQEKQISDKIKSIQEETQQLQSQKNTLEQAIAKGAITQITAKKDIYTIVDTSKHPSLWSIPFKSLVQIAKDMEGEYLLIEASWSFAIIGWQAKSFAQTHGLKWWWSDTFFQWKDPKIVEIIYNS